MEVGGAWRGEGHGWRVKAAALIHLKSAVIYHSDNTHQPVSVCGSVCVPECVSEFECVCVCECSWRPMDLQ